MCTCMTGEPCLHCQTATHAKQVWEVAQRRMTQAKIKGLERALRVEHSPIKARSIRNEILNLQASLG